MFATGISGHSSRTRGCPLREQQRTSPYFMSTRPSTTLADLFMPLRFGDLSSAVRASLRSWLNDEIDDGLAARPACSAEVVDR